MHILARKRAHIYLHGEFDLNYKLYTYVVMFVMIFVYEDLRRSHSLRMKQFEAAISRFKRYWTEPGYLDTCLENLRYVSVFLLVGMFVSLSNRLCVHLIYDLCNCLNIN